MVDADFNIFAGHYGQLSASQEAALVSFKKLLEDAKFYDPENPGRLDDPTLLRFLRARSWDPPAALKQYSDSMEWRQKNDVDNLYVTFDADELENTRRFYPRWTGRRDKNGMPIYVYRIASLDSALQKELHAVPPERRFQRIIALYEYMLRFSLPLCTHLPHSTSTPITCVMTIIDLEGVSIGSMWTLRSHLSESAKLATANYPETLSTIAIINAPSFFPTIWGWIKGWFDPGTRNKIHILGKNPGEDLLKLIDAENLPKQYGGTLEWEYKSEPSLDQPTKDAVGAEELPKGPHVFEDGKVGKP
ncbi:Sec14 cytosolic factor [Mycena indigotica]|uniref:Sec14 cytosolic factor n=1 Tax=Mycena indigotica TaxID=2126181 RepID=A0A8H6SH33_9AGAR|nr:Sec14 cytosolic factor [Mycena indigotica]KAF7299346.1 Sec14 cytosolic factor [Mycena indigotica]